MNPTGCRIVLRVRTPFEVLDLAIRLAQVDAGPLARLAAIVVLPAFVLAWTVGIVSGSLAWGLVTLIVLSPWMQLPFTMLGARRLFDPTVSVRDVLRQLPASWRAGVWRCVGLGVVVVASLLSVGMAALPLTVAVVFLGEVLALEQIDLRTGLTRAVRLASDQATLAIVGTLTMWTLGAWCVLAAEVGGQAVLGFVLQLGQPFGAVVTGTLTPFVLAGVAVAQPVIAWYRLLLYLDVRTAIEGWDLQVALKAAAEAA